MSGNVRRERRKLSNGGKVARLVIGIRERGGYIGSGVKKNDGRLNERWAKEVEEARTNDQDIEDYEQEKKKKEGK